MGRHYLGKRLKCVKRDVRNLRGDAEDAYEAVRKEMGRRAEKAWAYRSDIADDLMSVSESASRAMSRRFKEDPMGTIAVGAILVWFAGRVVRR